MLDELTTGQYFTLPIIVLVFVGLALVWHARRIQRWVEWAVVKIRDDLNAR